MLQAPQPRIVSSSPCAPRHVVRRTLRSVASVAAGSAALSLAMHGAVALACGGGAPVAPKGTAIDDLPFTEAFSIMVSWQEDLDGPALVSVGASIHNATDGFGYVVPIPQVIDSTDLSVGSSDLLDGLAAFTGPRALEKSCNSFRPDVELVCSNPERWLSGGGEGEGEWGGEESLGVAVETAKIGAYEVSLLTADGSTGLVAWLDAHDFALPPGSEGHIDQYLEQGFMFAAVSVPAGTQVDDGSGLPPLNFHLSEGFRTLPLLLASEAAQSTQDVLVTTLAPQLGAVGISNLPEASLEDGCMPREDDMGATYSDAFAKAHADADAAVWALEFYQRNRMYESMGEITSSVPLSGAQYTAIEEHFGSVEDLHHVGRIHIRYEPGQLTADPAFYAHAASDFEALEYIHYDAQLTEYLPVCGDGWVDEGSCPPTELDDRYCDADEGSARSGCSSLGRASGGSPWLALPLVVLFGARRQRRA
ncbi:MAG TPA: hypothetical protein DFR83_17860 [Deltaproteobacteria bacterium]|nr:hypothetical protein [Deltaproteobacteria bacterium]